MNVYEKLYDENNGDNIILYDDSDKPCEFEQIAMIPYGDFDYAVLHPVKGIEGVGETDVMIFRIEGEGADASLNFELDKEISGEVFKEFMKLVEEEFGEE